MSTTRLCFLCSCVRAGGWNGNCCCYSKGCTDIHFQTFGSALVCTTALEGSSSMEEPEVEILTETACLKYWLWRILVARNERFRPLLQ
jgi:hypothetical protein